MRQFWTYSQARTSTSQDFRDALAALRGVPPAPLPGLAGVGWMASAAPSPQPAASTPPAPHGGNRQGSGGSLDSWLHDKLFGQR
jgi:hypothetical protein